MSITGNVKVSELALHTDIDGRELIPASWEGVPGAGFMSYAITTGQLTSYVGSYLNSYLDISGKADKDTDAVEGNFAAFDDQGNPVDSGHKHSDYLTEHQDISGKADKDTDAVEGNFAYFNADGNPVDSSYKPSDFLTSHQQIEQDGIQGATVNRWCLCETGAAVAAKTVTVTTGEFTLKAGSRVTIKFANSNTANNPTLNVNNTGAKQIKMDGIILTDGSEIENLRNVLEAVYDGEYWCIISGAGGGTSQILGTINVTLTPLVNGVQGDPSLLNGAVVTVTNTTDSRVVGTRTWDGSILQFANLTPLKDYSISVSAVTNFTTPAAVSVLSLGIGANVNAPALNYEADQYTIDIDSDQSDKTDIANAKVTVLGNEYADGATFMVAKGTDIGTPTASTVRSYSSTVTVSGKTIYAFYVYSNLIVNVAMSDSDMTDLAKTKAYLAIDGATAVEMAYYDEGATRKFNAAVNTGASYVINFGSVEGYATPTQASGTKEAGEVTLSRTYGATIYTLGSITASENGASQGTLPADAGCTLDYVGKTSPSTLSNVNDSAKVPTGTTPTITVNDLYGYAESYTVSDAHSISVVYAADAYSLTVSTDQASQADIENTVIRVTATGISADGYIDFTGPQTSTKVLVPSGNVPTAECQSGAPVGYGETITVDTTNKTINVLYQYGVINLTVTMSDDDATALSSVAPSISISGGEATPMTKVADGSFTASVAPGLEYSITFNSLVGIGYQTPETISGTKGEAVESKTAEYSTTIYTFSTITTTHNGSVQGTNPSGAGVDVDYTGGTTKSPVLGGTVKVPSNLTPTVTANTCYGYKKGASLSGTNISVTYDASKYTLNITSDTASIIADTVTRISATGISADGYIDYTGEETDTEVLIPAGEDFTVDNESGMPEGYLCEVTITGYAINVSYALQRFVDFGLPSGLKWASANLLKSGNEWKIADNETDYGDFWSWGNVGDSSSTGYMPSSGGKMTQAMYNSTTGNQLTGNIPVDAAYDVARNRLGYPWRMPTKADFEELINNTDHEWTTINGKKGCKFMKKGDASVYVFFPASGNCYGSGLGGRGSSGYYWSSTYNSSSNAYCLTFGSSNVTTLSNLRYYGFSVRPVQSSKRTVSITVTGSTVAGVNLTLTDSEGTQHTATTDVSGTAEFTLVAYGTATLSSEEFVFNPNPITVSASAGSFTVAISPVYVDLGLPSGIKWASGNLLKSGDTCKMAYNETDYGDFWSWANVGLTNATGWMDAAGGTMTESMYNSTTGKSQTTNISGTDATHDVACKYLGAPWRLPTKAEFDELIANTDSEWTSINGIYGRKFKKKTDPSVYVFFPASGLCRDSGLYNRANRGYYWSSTCLSSSNAHNMNFTSSNVSTSNGYRYYGVSVRPVQSSKRTVTVTVTGETVEGVNITLTDSDGAQHTATTDTSGVAEFTSVAYGTATLSAPGYEFNPSTVTVSASAGSFSAEMFTARYVDLGLPSGLKWAAGNLKKSGEGCVMGGETEYGDFWSWANVGLTNSTGYMPSSGGKMTQAMYNSTTGKSQSANISGTDATHDVACKYLGAPWRLPTKAEFEELHNNTDHEWTTINGIYGRKFKKKGDASVYVFFPASGYCNGSGLNNRGSSGGYWGSTYSSSSDAYSLNFTSSNVLTYSSSRYCGFSVRPVQ